MDTRNLPVACPSVHAKSDTMVPFADDCAITYTAIAQFLSTDRFINGKLHDAQLVRQECRSFEKPKPSPLQYCQNLNSLTQNTTQSSHKSMHSHVSSANSKNSFETKHGALTLVGLFIVNFFKCGKINRKVTNKTPETPLSEIFVNDDGMRQFMSSKRQAKY